MFRNLPLAVVLALSLIVPGAALAAPPKVFPVGSSGIGDPYFPLDGNGGYDVQHYDLEVSYDPATDRLSGVVTMEDRVHPGPFGVQPRLRGACGLRSLTVDGVAAANEPQGSGAHGEAAGAGSGAEREVHGRRKLRRRAENPRGFRCGPGSCIPQTVRSWSVSRTLPRPGSR